MLTIVYNNSPAKAVLSAYPGNFKLVGKRFSLKAVYVGDKI